ncbi:MAG: hypothetical protein D6797_08355, partial [Bdellovibrio sp.]
YWRVISEKSSQNFVSTYFYALDDRPVKLSFPYNGANLFPNSSKKNHNLIFSWEKKWGVSTYMAQVSMDKAFKKLAAEDKIQGTKWKVSLDSHKKYYWRVRPVLKDKNDLWSLVYPFSLGIKKIELPVISEVPQEVTPTLPPSKELQDTSVAVKLEKPQKPVVPPQILNPQRTVVLRFSKSVNVRSPASVRKNLLNPPKFVWKKGSLEDKVLLEVSLDPDFSNLLVRQEVSGTHWFWKDVQPGEFYWRVSSPDKEISSQNIGKLKVLVPPTSNPKKIVKNFVYKNPANYDRAESVPVQWDPVPFANKYKVIFKKPLKKVQVVKKTSVALSAKKPGHYLIKVASLDAKGRRISSYKSSQIIINKKIDIPPPKLLMPNDGVAFLAMGEDQFNPVVFHWSKVKYKKFYEIEYAQDPSFSKVLLQEKPKGVFYVLKKPFPAGTVFWRVRAFYGKGYSPWSAPQSFQIQKLVKNPRTRK